MIRIFTLEENNALRVRKLAILHKNYITSGFLSSLNLSILASIYSELIKFHILIVAENDGEIVGFISCSKNLKKLYLTYISRNFWWVTFVLIPYFFSKGFIKKVYESLLIPFSHRTDSGNKEYERMPELLSIVVSSEFQRTGLGKLLLDKLEMELKENNLTQIRVVAGSNLKSANSFYLKNGFKLYKTAELHKGIVSNYYSKEL